MQRIVQSKVVAHWRERDRDIMTSKDKEHLIENILRFINNFWATVLPSKSLRDANARSQRSSSLGRHWSSSSRGNDNENIFSTANGCCGSVGRVVAYETRDPRFESGQDGQRFLWLSCRAVASDTRDPRFESRLRQFFLLSIVCNLYWKDEYNEKIVLEWPI